MEKRVYKENPLKVAVNIVIGMSIFLLVMIFLVVYVFPGRPSTPGEKITGVIIALGLAFGVMILPLLIFWLAIKKRTITIDLTGAEIIAKRPFGQPEAERFQWKDVSAVCIDAQTAHNSPTSYQLSITVSGREIYLMKRTFLNKTLKNLVADVGAATRHLGYVWEECRADETRPVLEAVAPFCKVALNNAIIFAS